MPDTTRLARSAAGFVIAIATAAVILAASVAPFLSPAWVSFEQDRVGAAALTGFSEPELHRVTNAILADLVLGGGDFRVTAGGTAGSAPVLNDRERSHMLDVRGVFRGFDLLAIASLAILAVAAWRSRNDAAPRSRVWRSFRRGAQGLAVGVVVAAGMALVAFDAAFAVFHSLFFAQGTFDFDPRTNRIVQLFPDAFWSETTIAVGVVAIVAALAIASVARGRGAVAAEPGAAEAATEPSTLAGAR